MPKKTDQSRPTKDPTSKKGPPPVTRTKMDVLLGRGRGCTGSEGNQRYLGIVEQFAPLYLKASNRKAQYRVKLSIIDAVKENGGRFLQPVAGSNEQEWQEAELQVVLDKIAQSLRYHNRKGKPEEDQPAPKAVPLAAQSLQPATLAPSAFTSVTPPVTLDPAMVWPILNRINTNHPFPLRPSLFTNPGLNAAMLRGGLFPSTGLLSTLQKAAANEERLQEELWRNISFLHGAQESNDRLLSAYREEL